MHQPPGCTRAALHAGREQRLVLVQLQHALRVLIGKARVTVGILACMAKSRSDLELALHAHFSLHGDVIVPPPFGVHDAIAVGALDLTARQAESGAGLNAARGAIPTKQGYECVQEAGRGGARERRNEVCGCGV